MQLQPRHKKYLYIALAAFLVLFGYLLYSSAQFKVASTTPNHKKYPSSLGTMDIQFNRELDAGFIKEVSEDPASFIELRFDSAVTARASKDTLKLTFSQTPKPGKYKIILKNIRASDGSVLNKDLAFVVKDIPYDSMNKTEQGLYDDLSADADTDVVDEHPELIKLPHQTDEYMISYNAEEARDINSFRHEHGTPQLTISMKFFQPGNNARPATPEQQQAYIAQIRTHRQAAIDWLLANGFNLEEYGINYSEPEIQEEFPRGKIE